MLSHLCRLSFWLAALVAVLALMAPPQLGTWLTGMACIATVLAWGLWRAGLTRARHDRALDPGSALAGFGEPALGEIGLRAGQAVDAAPSFDAALLEVGRIFKSELGLRDVRALRVEQARPESVEIAEVVEGRTVFCTAARRVRLDPSSTLARALRLGEVVVGPEGGAALPVRVDGRTVAVLELGPPVVPMSASAFGALLALAQEPLSRRGSHPALCVGAAAAAALPCDGALHDNADRPPLPAMAMTFPRADDPSTSTPPRDRGAAAYARPAAARLDAGALARLSELDPTGASQLVRRVLNAFTASAARLMPQFEAARAGPDLVVLRYVAHTLKSSSASIGALALAQTCAEVENLIRTSETQGLEPLLDTLSAQIADVLREIDAMLGLQA
ncbi:MAG: Hpt domain-containing protein [Burkholderiaceae bacterium]